MEKSVDPAERKHNFFKILTEDDDETRMRIPEAFYPRISIESQSCERAVIQGPSGDYWIVKVNKSDDGIFLEKGWEVFVRENGLQMYDFLVFRYDGSMQFSVKVYNMKGVPREECFAPVRSRRGRSSGCPPVGRPHTSLRSRERRPAVEQPRQQDCDESDEDYDEDESDEDYDEDESDEDYDEDEEESHEDEPEEDNREDEVPNRTSDLSSLRKKVGKYVASAIKMERGLASRSRFPFFSVVIQPSYMNYLPIPPAIRRKYFPNDLKKVILKASDTSDKRLWKFGISRSKTGAMKLSKGVSEFVSKKNGMNLKIGDVCIFEIVKRRSYKLLLQVHVIRH